MGIWHIEIELDCEEYIYNGSRGKGVIHQSEGGPPDCPLWLVPHIKFVAPEWLDHVLNGP